MYSAMSIIEVLKANEDFASYEIDKIKCPSPSTHSCQAPNDPSKCENCLKRDCEQTMMIFYKRQRLGILAFNFMVSADNQDGLIDEDDSSLKQFIRRGLDKSKFRTVS